MILLGLGSNLGDRAAQLASAVQRMKSHPQITVEQMSSLYETEPFGFKEQAAFLNAVIRIKSDLMPEALLAFCQSIECEMGRKRMIRWGPRTIDIDLLIFDHVTMNTAHLTLPHPYLAHRRFVLVPIEEITGEIILEGHTAKELLAVCPDEGHVELYRGIPEAKEMAYTETRKDSIDERANRRGACKGS